MAENNIIYEVGKFYNVPCAIVEVLTGKYAGKKWIVPIIGISHVDTKFGNLPLPHYHLDGRFTSGKNGPYDTDEYGYTSGVVVSCDTVFSKFIGIETKRKKCKRLTTGLSMGIRKDERYSEWYKSMLGKSCKGKKCPHFGTEMLEREGVLVCPLHNLTGDILKEKIIPRR